MGLLYLVAKLRLHQCMLSVTVYVPTVATYNLCIANINIPHFFGFFFCRLCRNQHYGAAQRAIKASTRSPLAVSS